MSANPIRVATSALSERIFAGRPTKDGKGFKEPRYDVTSDVLLAIRDKVGVGNEVAVSRGGGAVEFRIAVLPPALAAGTQSAGTNGDSAQSEGCQSGPKGNAQPQSVPNDHK